VHQDRKGSNPLQIDQSINHPIKVDSNAKSATKIKTMPYAAVGTASHQHE
jgi:hypothetical protein